MESSASGSGDEVRLKPDVTSDVRRDAGKEAIMTNSRYLAGLVGPTIVVLAITEALNLDVLRTNTAATIYFNGTVLFVVGLALIRAHNVWTREWPVMLTITGWVALVMGLYRMFVPGAPQAPENAASYVGLLLLAAYGAVLTFKGYTGEEAAGKPTMVV
jgi:uncharacterized membrane protein HdeD (DUF308 family)